MALAPGAADRAPSQQADIVAWAPLLAGDRVLVHLRSGGQLDRILRGGDDSSLFFDTPTQTDIFAHGAGPDTLKRVSISHLERLEKQKNTGAGYSGAFGAILGAILGIVLVGRGPWGPTS